MTSDPQVLDLRGLAGTRESLVYQDGGQFPVLAALPDGSIVGVLRGGAGHVGLAGRIEIVRSRDGGRSWTPSEIIADSERDDRNPALGRQPARDARAGLSSPGELRHRRHLCAGTLRRAGRAPGRGADHALARWRADLGAALPARPADPGDRLAIRQDRQPARRHAADGALRRGRSRSLRRARREAGAERRGPGPARPLQLPAALARRRADLGRAGDPRGELTTRLACWRCRVGTWWRSCAATCRTTASRSSARPMAASPGGAGATDRDAPASGRSCRPFGWQHPARLRQPQPALSRRGPDQP